jgi:hypothetical protein
MIHPAWIADSRASLPASALEDSDDERARQAIIMLLERQLNAMRRTAGEIGFKFSDPRQDPEELQDDLDKLERRIFQLGGQIENVRASQQIRFPSANEIADLGNAVAFLEARIASSAAANALMAAADNVIAAFSL